MKPKETNNGKRGGLLKGKPHYSKDGKPLGGIKAIVTDTNQPVELEGGEVIINKEASKKHWKELSRINQSAGGGVPIHPPDGADDDVDENDFARGGKVIVFRKNHIPKAFIYNYAKKIKEQYPQVWDMGGNIFGNEAYKNLERVYLRGYWLDSEEWMYKKWQAFNARHAVDIRIAGIVANLKWLNVVNKGWSYMKKLIEEEIKKKYADKKSKGGIVTYKDRYNKKYGYDKGESHTLSEVASDTGKSKKGLQQIYNKGIGAFKTNPESVRPNVKSKEQWAMGRVYSAVMGGKAAKVDAKELKMKNGGELKKGIKVEKEHIDTARKLYNRKITPEQAAESVAREHLKENPHYYTKLLEMEKKFDKGGIMQPSKFSMPTPTGAPSKLTYRQQILVRTRQFKEWFGDWETAAKEFVRLTVASGKEPDAETFYDLFKSCSSVFDYATLEPRIVFHGTQASSEFFKFEVESKVEEDTGKIHRPYAYFAYNPSYSLFNFSRLRQIQIAEERGENIENKDWHGLYEVFLNVRQPYIAVGDKYDNVENQPERWLAAITAQLIQIKYKNEIPDLNKPTHQAIRDEVVNELGNLLIQIYMKRPKFHFWRIMALDINGKFKQLLKKYGFDGILFSENCCADYNPENPVEFTYAVIAFDSYQIKLADGRNTTFSKLTDDIRFDDGGNIKERLNIREMIYGESQNQDERQFIVPYIQTNREYLSNLFEKVKANERKI